METRRLLLRMVLTVGQLVVCGAALADPPFVPRAVRPPIGSRPRNLCHVNGVLYYAADDDVHGEELWRSDGTEAGTYMLKDIRDDDPGPFARGCRPHDLTAVGQLLFFIADDGKHGDELWVSDGTEEGTYMVVDFVSGVSSSRCEYLTSFKGKLFLRAETDTHYDELWKSDGTASGTQMVKDILPGPVSSKPHELTVVGDELFFVADDHMHGLQLWKTDGTTQGTVRVTNVNCCEQFGSRGFPGFCMPRRLTAVGETLFFLAGEQEHGLELWTSDGTEPNTVMVKDANPDPNCPVMAFVLQHAVAVNDVFIYTYWDGEHGLELWASDGTEANTMLVKDIVPGPNFPIIWEVEAVGDTVFFACYDFVHGVELWKTDGTEPNTVMVKDIEAMFGGFPGSKPADLTAWNDIVLFFATKFSQGTELWRSDGTEAGTVPVCDEDFVGVFLPTLTNADGTLFFRGATPGYGNELWCYRPDYGDTDYDADVDFVDFAVMSEHLGDKDCNLTNAFCGRADITDYGVVNFLDIVVFAQNWLRGLD